MSKTLSRTLLLIGFVILVGSSILAWFLAPYHLGLN